MTGEGLIEKVAAMTGGTKKDAEKFVKATFAAVGDAMAAGDKVSIVGFGTFEVKSRGARKGRNPQTGQEITIPAKNAPTFKAGKGLADKVAGK